MYLKLAVQKKITIQWFVKLSLFLQYVKNF